MLDFAPSVVTPSFAFGPHDKVTINGIAYRLIDRREDGYVFVRLDALGVAESFSRSEMSHLVTLGHVKQERDALLPANAKERLALPSELLSLLPAEQHRRAKLREAAVIAFLEMERSGDANRTDVSIERARNAITGRASVILAGACQYSDHRAPSGELTAPKFSTRTLRRWLSAYENLGLAGLYDAAANRGNRDRRLCTEALTILSRCAQGYLTRQEPMKATIYDNVRVAFRDENERRRAEGRSDLVRPSKETVRKAILALDPYQCDLARKGKEYARRKHAPVGMGIDVTRPLQRVEMDTWKVDLMTLMASSGLSLSDEERQSLGLIGGKKRWHLTVAICAATRCILAMRLSRTPTAASTVRTMDMIVQDKGIWSDAVGSLSSWHMFGLPELIVTDCGSEYVSFDARVAARDLGVALEHAPAGHPEMRARIERLFKTFAVNLLPRLTGRTFSNIIERGDYDSKARAALTADDLCAALIRWVVDIYHRQPHDGLDGESPARCWERLTEQYGVAASPDTDRRRIAFGTRMTRTLSKGGVSILGVRYQVEEYARKAVGKVGKPVNLRWHHDDIGAIAVELDGEWIEVPAVMRGCKGVSAQTWTAARRALAARYKQEAAFDEDVVLKAIAEIEAINGNAMRRIGLLVEDWSKERLEREEERLFIGFDCRRAEEREADEASLLSYGDELETATCQAFERTTQVVADPVAMVQEPARKRRASKSGKPAGGEDDTGEPGFAFEDK
jgi:putative transposase